jgi:steroid 5-alpha reductase family enzyme
MFLHNTMWTFKVVVRIPENVSFFLCTHAFCDALWHTSFHVAAQCMAQRTERCARMRAATTVVALVLLWQAQLFVSATAADGQPRCVCQP